MHQGNMVLQLYDQQQLAANSSAGQVNKGFGSGSLGHWHRRGGPASGVQDEEYRGNRSSKAPASACKQVGAPHLLPHCCHTSAEGSTAWHAVAFLHSNLAQQHTALASAEDSL